MASTEIQNGIPPNSSLSEDEKDKVVKADDGSALGTPKASRSKDKKVKKEKSSTKENEETHKNGNQLNGVDGSKNEESKNEKKKKKRKQDDANQNDTTTSPPTDTNKEIPNSSETNGAPPKSILKSTSDVPKEQTPENDEKDGSTQEHGLKSDKKIKKQGSSYSKTSEKETLEKREEKKKEEKLDVDSGNDKKSKQSKSDEDHEKQNKSNSDNEKSPSRIRKKKSFLMESIDKRRKKDSINSASDSDGEDVADLELVRNPELKELLISERHRAKTKSRLFVHKTNEIGQIIYKGHPSWELMGDIQTAIRHVIGKSAKLIASEELEVKTQDIHKSAAFFKETIFLRFPRAGSAETPSHNFHNFKFKDYCPLVFRHLRQKFNIDPADYMVSLCNTLPDGTNALRELPTPGKSGSLFFFSQDQRYILKTIPKREAKLLRGLLPAYYYHVMENPDTLLPKFFGLHRIKPTGGRQVRFVVMENVFRTQKEIHERYDLKGSIFGRAASEEEKKKIKNVTYKDVDWRAREKRLHLGPERKAAFIEQLRKDCSLLEKLNIMDYSMLVGVHYCNNNDGGDCITECIHVPARKELERRKKERKEKRAKDKEEKTKENGSKETDKKEKPGKEEEIKGSKETKKENEKPVDNSKSKKEKRQNEDKKTKKKTEETHKTERKTEASSSQESLPETQGTISTIISKVTETMRGKSKSLDPDSEAESSQSKLPPSLRHKSITMTTYPLPDHYQESAVSAYQQDDGGMLGISNKGEILHEFYYVGIIDILMLWSMRKKAEHAYKSLKAKPDEISSVAPKEYSARFQKFVTEHVVD